MRVAIDAMGGDFAPVETVKGAVLAAPLINGEIILVGDQQQLSQLLPSKRPSNIKIVNSTQIVEMDDSPLRILSKKPDSSLVVAAKLVNDKEADALVTAGNTGAAVSVTALLWKIIPGIQRPAIATILPTLKGYVVMLDAGANIDCEPRWLEQFGFMGQAFCEKVLNVKNPKVGLLNIGEEPGKGNALTKKTYDLLEKCIPNFIGNVEGGAVFSGVTDVIVCDGFVGNVLLKTSEGVAHLMLQTVKEELPKFKLFQLPLLMYVKTKKRVQKRMDYSEYGGAPLLGVNGICIISHGRSNAKAIKNAILEAAKAYENDLLNAIAERARIEALEISNVK